MSNRRERQRAAAKTIEEILEAVRTGELEAGAELVAHLEGALAALETCLEDRG